MKLFDVSYRFCWIAFFATLCLSGVESAADTCKTNCTWNPWQDPTQCSQQCGPKGIQVRIRDGVDGDCKCLEDDTREIIPCNRVCLNGGEIGDYLGEETCICKTGFHGECCEHGFDLTTFVVVYVIIILLCFVFVMSMFCVGEYRHRHVLQAIPTTYETEFDDWEEEKPLLEPKFVWTAPHESRKVGNFYKSWDTYSEFSSRAGSAMSADSLSIELDPDTGEKKYKGRDLVLEKLDIFEIAQLRNFADLDRTTRSNLVDKIAPRLDFEEQIKLRSFDSLSEEEVMEMMSRLLEIATIADSIKEGERAELAALEENPVFDEMDEDVLEMMGRFEELTSEERAKVLEQLEGVLTEKEKIKLANFEQLSKREQDALTTRLLKLQSVGKKVEEKRKASALKDEGKIELATSEIEGVISVPSLRTAIKSDAIATLLRGIGMSIGCLNHRPDARMEIRSRVLAKMMLMSEDEVLELCRLDGMDPEEVEKKTHEERMTYLADRASCACVADVQAIEAEILEEQLRAEEAARAGSQAGTSTVSSLSGVMSMSSSEDSDDDNDAAPKKPKKVDLSKIKWSGPPKGAKPAFTRGNLSLGVLSTSVKKFKERERAGTIAGRANIRSQALSERLLRSQTQTVTGPDTMKHTLRHRLSSQQPLAIDEEDTSSVSSR